MTFLAPQALWLLALLPVVVALHYLRARRRQRDVAALFLWRRAQANSARRKRISPSWLLALQLMFIAAASVGVAGPRLTAAADDGVIIVIDGSASMAAAAEVDAAAGTRLSLAVATARQHLAGRSSIALVRAGVVPRLLVPLDAPQSELLAALDALRAGDSQADLLAAVDLGKGLLPDADVVGLLARRRDELVTQLQADARRLAQVQARLRLIEKENPMSTFHETSLPELSLAQKSVRVTDMATFESEMGPLFDAVMDAVVAAGLTPVGPGVALYTPDGDAMIAAAAEPLGGAPTPEGLQPVTVASVDRALTTQYVAPDLAGIQQAWQALVTEVERRGLQPHGTCREVYLATPYDGDDSDGWVVDLQQPVA